MADATTEPKLAPAETEKPLQVEAKDEAPKETPAVRAIGPLIQLDVIWSFKADFDDRP